MHDVVIVGGGPAGATAAYLLKLQNLDVVVIDKSTFPRPKLCGGLITYKTLQLLRRVYGETLETLQKKHIIEYVANSYEIKIGNRPFASSAADPPFVLVDRSVYDAYLLDRAKEIGVTVMEGDPVTHIDPSNRQVLTSSGRVLQARFILGADGVNSRVRQCLPETRFNQKRWKSNLGAGLEVFIPRSDLEAEIKSPAICFGWVNWGYAWIFPNRERVVVGLGGLARHNKSMKKSLQALVSSLGNIKGPLPQPFGHPVPYGNFLSSPAFGSILLLGDAAGLVDPFLGEGIYYAQRSAELAARCIQEEMHDGDCVEVTYPPILQGSMLGKFTFMKRWRWALFGLSANVSYFPLRLFLRVLGTGRAYELVQGSRSSGWLGKRLAIDDETSIY